MSLSSSTNTAPVRMIFSGQTAGHSDNNNSDNSDNSINYTLGDLDSIVSHQQTVAELIHFPAIPIHFYWLENKVVTR